MCVNEPYIYLEIRAHQDVGSRQTQSSDQNPHTSALPISPSCELIQFQIWGCRALKSPRRSIVKLRAKMCVSARLSGPVPPSAQRTCEAVHRGPANAETQLAQELARRLRALYLVSSYQVAGASTKGTHGLDEAAIRQSPGFIDIGRGGDWWQFEASMDVE